MDSQKLIDFIVDKLEDIKAQDIVVLNVHTQTDVMDYMIIASGTSTQHVRSIAQNLLREAKTYHVPVLGSEGEEAAEWVLIDLADAVVHVMMPQTRAYYELEKLWSVEEAVPKARKPKTAANKKPTAKRKPVTKKTATVKKPAAKPAAKKPSPEKPATRKPVAKKPIARK